MKSILGICTFAGLVGVASMGASQLGGWGWGFATAIVIPTVCALGIRLLEDYMGRETDRMILGP